jgi:hypothetical protein
MPVLAREDVPSSHRDSQKGRDRADHALEVTAAREASGILVDASGHAGRRETRADPRS